VLDAALSPARPTDHEVRPRSRRQAQQDAQVILNASSLRTDLTSPVYLGLIRVVPHLVSTLMGRMRRLALHVTHNGVSTAIQDCIH